MLAHAFSKTKPPAAAPKPPANGFSKLQSARKALVPESEADDDERLDVAGLSFNRDAYKKAAAKPVAPAPAAPRPAAKPSTPAPKLAAAPAPRTKEAPRPASKPTARPSHAHSHAAPHAHAHSHTHAHSNTPSALAYFTSGAASAHVRSKPPVAPARAAASPAKKPKKKRASNALIDLEAVESDGEGGDAAGQDDDDAAEDADENGDLEDFIEPEDVVRYASDSEEADSEEEERARRRRHKRNRAREREEAHSSEEERPRRDKKARQRAREPEDDEDAVFEPERRDEEEEEPPRHSQAHKDKEAPRAAQPKPKAAPAPPARPAQPKPRPKPAPAPEPEPASASDSEARAPAAEDKFDDTLVPSEMLERLKAACKSRGKATSRTRAFNDIARDTSLLYEPGDSVQHGVNTYTVCHRGAEARLCKDRPSVMDVDAATPDMYTTFRLDGAAGPTYHAFLCRSRYTPHEVSPKDAFVIEKNFRDRNKSAKDAPAVAARVDLAVRSWNLLYRHSRQHRQRLVMPQTRFLAVLKPLQNKSVKQQLEARYGKSVLTAASKVLQRISELFCEIELEAMDGLFSRFGDTFLACIDDKGAVVDDKLSELVHESAFQFAAVSNTLTNAKHQALIPLRLFESAEPEDEDEEEEDDDEPTEPAPRAKRAAAAAPAEPEEPEQPEQPEEPEETEEPEEPEEQAPPARPRQAKAKTARPAAEDEEEPGPAHRRAAPTQKKPAAVDAKPKKAAPAAAAAAPAADAREEPREEPPQEDASADEAAPAAARPAAKGGESPAPDAPTEDTPAEEPPADEA